MNVINSVHVLYTFPPNRKLIPNSAASFMAFGLVVLGCANVRDMTHGHQLQALPIGHLVSDMLSIV